RPLPSWLATLGVVAQGHKCGTCSHPYPHAQPLKSLPVAVLSLTSGKPLIRKLDLIDSMIASSDAAVSDEELARIEESACPTCGSCSGMFTANSMTCLNEAIGLALPGNGTVLATHALRRQLFDDAARLLVANTKRYYLQGDRAVLPRSIATFEAFENA